MIITYNIKPLFFIDLGSFSKSHLKLKLWVVKLLKLKIEKSWLDYQDTRCCNLAIQYMLPKSSIPFYEKLSTYVSPMVSGLEAFILDYWEKNTNWKSTIIWWNNWRYIIWRSRRTQLLALFKYPLLHSCMPKEFPIFDIKIGVAAIIFHTLEKKWRDAL